MAAGNPADNLNLKQQYFLFLNSEKSCCSVGVRVPLRYGRPRNVLYYVRLSLVRACICPSLTMAPSFAVVSISQAIKPCCCYVVVLSAFQLAFYQAKTLIVDSSSQQVERSGKQAAKKSLRVQYQVQYNTIQYLALPFCLYKYQPIPVSQTYLSSIPERSNNLNITKK